jgi:hypothetical protein
MFVLIDTTQQDGKHLGKIADRFRSFRMAGEKLYGLNRERIAGRKKADRLFTGWHSLRGRPRKGSWVDFADEENFRAMSPEEYIRLRILEKELEGIL